jgi:hypothetical protein
MNGKIRRPASALQTRAATRVGQCFAYLDQCRVGVGPAKTGSRGVSGARPEDHQHGKKPRNQKRRPACHVASPLDDSDSLLEGSIANKGDKAGRTFSKRRAVWFFCTASPRPCADRFANQGVALSVSLFFPPQLAISRAQDCFGIVTPLPTLNNKVRGVHLCEEHQHRHNQVERRSPLPGAPQDGRKWYDGAISNSRAF